MRIDDKIYGKSRLKSVSYIIWFILLSIIIICVPYRTVIGCIPFEDLSTTRDTAITMEVQKGDQFNITCCLQNHSSCLNFKEENNYTSPYQRIQILNESAINLINRKAEDGRYVYVCACDEKGLQRTIVFVGSAPKGIAHFECVVFNFQRMECTIKPYRETIYTQYNISEMKRKDSQLDVFETDDFVYRSDRQFFHFVINSSNSLGYRIENKIINQYNIVKPDLPVVHIRKITTNSVTLSWSIPNYQTYIKYTDGLVYEFFLKTKNFEWFKIMPDIKSYNEYFWVEINNLFSYMEYSVHLRVKANKTIDDDRMWSRKFIENFTTLSGPPNKSPEIDIGSFSFYPEGKFLSLFWRKLPEYEQNGPNFTYKITSIKEDGQVINPTIIMNKHLSSALIFIEWKNTSKYQFELKSQNQMGFSTNSSVLKISPRHLNISHEEQKQAITKIYHKTNQTYTITWLRPINVDALNSFTLFWCEARTGSKNQCQGRVDFKTLDKISLNYMTGQFNTSLNFALSENYYNGCYSSGMLWAMCAPDDETKIFSISIDKVTKRTESTITIHWIKKCWHMTYIDGYILTYCEANSKKCEEKIVPKDANNYEIIGLKSSTLYKITLRTFLETTLGQISDFVMEATTEENDKTKSIITICLSIMTTAVTLGLLLSLRNKCRKMQKIGVILPEAPKEDAIIPTENDSNGFLLDQKQLIKSNNYLTTTNSAHSITDINDQNCSCYQPIPTRENKKSISTSIEENYMISDSNQKAENSYSKISTFQNLSGGYVSPSLIFTQLQQRTATSNKNSSPPLNDGDELPMDLKSIYNPANDQTTKINEKPKYFNGYI